MRFLPLALFAFFSLPALAAQDVTITWKELRQDHFVGRIRSIAWGAGGQAYDYNTPFFVEALVCPIWFRGDGSNVGTRDISTGSPARYGSEFSENECRKLATSSSHTTYHGQTRQLNESLNIPESTLRSAIASMKNPAWYNRNAPVAGEAGYVLRVLLVSDYSILPGIPRVLGRVGMRTAVNVLADHYVELPLKDLGIDGVDQARADAKLRQAGVALVPFRPGQRIETQEKTYGYVIELAR